MNFRSFSFVVVLSLTASLTAKIAESQAPGIAGNSKISASSSDGQSTVTKVPQETILVKGASPSTSDSVTPLPENGTVTHGTFSNPYFGITYRLPQDWTQEYEGPPPSESARYVLAQLGPPNAQDGPASASMLITAQDMFFTPLPAANALELTEYIKDHLQDYYRLETAPRLAQVADHSFSFLAYWSPAAELHWYVLAIQIRCHVVQFVLTGRDTKLLESLMLDLNKMNLPGNISATTGDGGGAYPVCIKDYAQNENVIARVDPAFTEHRFNSIPVRIIIDKQGNVKHVHLISAFPDQARAITDALVQWKFKPYLRDGKPVEVETGILFGRAPYVAPQRTAKSAVH